MFNCVVVKINGRVSAIFPSIELANAYRDMYRAAFDDVYGRSEIFCDLSYIADLPF